MDNPQLATGAVEVGDCTVEVLSAAEPPPFAVEDRAEVDEAVRLRHRYVDLRRPRMQANLRLRATVNAALRRAFERQGFCEVETPLLWAPTPEGAREFAVPSRLHHGAFYVLPQSPQLAKQLLMVGGFDRYYQIARCLRDEDLRADRQFEFTQLDIEASFVDQADVLGFVSEAVLDAAEAATGERPGPIEQMTWAEAIDRYGTDKPDLRFGMELVDLSAVFAGTEVRAFAAPVVKALRGRGRRLVRPQPARRPGGAGQGPRGQGPGLVQGGRVRRRRGPRLPARPLLVRGRAGRPPRRPPGPRPGTWCWRWPTSTGRPARSWASSGSTSAGAPWARGRTATCGWWSSRCSTGSTPRATRCRPTTPSPCPTPTTSTCWRPTPPPCAPRPTTWCSTAGSWGRAACGSTAPTSSRGSSRRSGSPRRRRPRASASCSGAFRYGAPPHAGFAFGIDRLVAIFCGEENIREVIAFPKTQSGADPMTGAPKPLAPAALADLGIRVVAPPGGAGSG